MKKVILVLVILAMAVTVSAGGYVGVKFKNTPDDSGEACIMLSPFVTEYFKIESLFAHRSVDHEPKYVVGSRAYIGDVVNLFAGCGYDQELEKYIDYGVSVEFQRRVETVFIGVGVSNYLDFGE